MGTCNNVLACSVVSQLPRQASWRKTLEVFDEQQKRATTLRLFPEDRPAPAAVLDTIQVKLNEMQLRRARPYGNCWLGCELWRQLELDRFWERKLPRGREDVSWPQVLELLVVNRLIDPGSEFRVHRQWFDQSAMDVLPGVDFAVAGRTGCTAAWIEFWSTGRSCSSIAAALEDTV